MIKVSVIIPIYNVEKYLRECLDSVVNQTLKDIEIILINNGSTDSSAEIIEEYKRVDNRIKSIDNKINLTAGEARNQGLEIAKGEYLSFLDSDDWFELDMLEMLYNTCKRNQTDIGVFNAEIFDSESRKIVSQIKAPYFFRSKFELENIKTFDCKTCLFNIFNPAAWNKLVRTEYVRKNNIKFQEIPVANDVAFVVQALFFANSFSYIDKCFVHYRQNRQNCLSNQREKNAMFCYEALVFAKNQLRNSDRFIHFFDSFFRFLLENLYQALKNTTEEDYEKVKKMLVNNKELFEIRNGENVFIFNKCNNLFYKSICNLDYNEFVKEDFAKAFYLFNYSKAINFIKSNSGDKIGLWGAGKNGKAFLEVFGEKIDIKCIIDEDIKKQGTYLDDIKITSFDESKVYIDTIIVTNEMFCEEILGQVRKYNKEICVIDLDSYLRFEISDKYIGKNK